MLYKFLDKFPVINDDSFIADSADIIGDVHISEEVSIWFKAVLRGDGNAIVIGRGSNVQDNCIIHINTGEYSTNIGEYVTIGHGAIIHGAKVGDNSLIGMGTIILDGAEVGSNTIVGAGSLIPPGKKIPDGVLCMGSPIKVIRKLDEEEKLKLKSSALQYIELYKKYLETK